MSLRRIVVAAVAAFVGGAAFAAGCGPDCDSTESGDVHQIGRTTYVEVEGRERLIDATFELTRDDVFFVRYETVDGDRVTVEYAVVGSDVELAPPEN